MKSHWSLLAVMCAVSQFCGPGAIAADIVPSTQILSANRQVQVFSRSFDVTPEQAAAPLTLTVTNGSFSGLKFAWIRIFVVNSKLGQAPAQPSGRMVLNEQAFRTSDIATAKLTGVLRAGGNTLLFQGAGVPGAGITYQVSGPEAKASGAGAKTDKAGGAAKSKAVQITSVDPKDVSGDGVITIHGTGFDDDFAKHNVVMIANREAQVQNVKETEIQVKIPDRLPEHEQTVQVTVNGVASNKATVNVIGPPEVSGCSPSVMQPLSTAEITGTNFSTDPSKNVVTIMFYNPEIKKTVTVVSAKKNSLTISIPEFPEMVGNSSKSSGAPAEISVTVNGVKCKSTCQANIRATAQ